MDSVRGVTRAETGRREPDRVSRQRVNVAVEPHAPSQHPACPGEPHQGGTPASSDRSQGIHGNPPEDPKPSRPPETLRTVHDKSMA